MPHPDAKHVVQSYLSALRERDADAIPQLVAADAVYRVFGSHPLAGTWVGFDEILTKFMIPMSELFDPHAPYAVETTQVFGEGDQVAVECVTRSTTVTGRPYVIDICSLFTVTDGKITSMREYFDTQYFARTLFENDDPAEQKETV